MIVRCTRTSKRPLSGRHLRFPSTGVETRTVKLETRFKETKDGPDVAHILTFADYQEADGVKYFSRVKLYRDETLILDMEVTELKRLDKIDDGRFAKP